MSRSSAPTAPHDHDATGVRVIDAIFSEYPFPGFMDPIRERAAEFERRHPQYRIEVHGCYYEDVPAKVAELAAQGRPPALATYYSGATQQARDTRTRDGDPLFTPIERAVAGRTEILGEQVVLDDIVPAARDFFTRDGEVVAVPFVLSTMLMYTNTTLLGAAGLTDVPSTWQELLEACRTVASHTGGPAHRITWPIDGKLFQQGLAQQGGRLVDNDNGHAGRATRVDLTCDAMMAYIAWWRQLHDEGHYCHTGELEDWPGSFRAFAGQQVVFRFGSSFDVNFMAGAATENGFELAVSPLPHNGDVPRAGNWIGGDAFWLADGLDAATSDGALAFVQYVSAPQHVATWHERSGSTPSTGAAVAELGRRGWFDRFPHHRTANDQLAMTTRGPGSCAPVLPGSHGVQRAMMQAMDDVLVHAADPRERFAMAEVDAQRALDAYNLICLGPDPRDPSWLVVGT